MSLCNNLHLRSQKSSQRYLEAVTTRECVALSTNLCTENYDYSMMTICPKLCNLSNTFKMYLK